MSVVVRPLPPHVVPIIRVRREHHRDGDQLRFVEGCPHCGRRHLHGIGDGGKAGWHGHRVAHCPLRDAGGYYLLEEGARLPAVLTP